MRKKFPSEAKHKLITGNRCVELRIKPTAFLSAFPEDIQEHVHVWENVLECGSCSICSPVPKGHHIAIEPCMEDRARTVHEIPQYPVPIL